MRPNWALLKEEYLNNAHNAYKFETFKQINTSDGKISLQVPIVLNEKETIPTNYLSKQTEIKLTGIYVDANGKENRIEKSMFNHFI